MNSTEQDKFMPFVSGESGPAVEKPLTSMTADLMNETAMDPFAGISERQKFNASSIILAGVIAAGCGGLWFMRSLTKAGAASIGDSQAEANVEKFLTGLNNKPGGTHGAITGDASVLAVLSGSYAERQVPLDAVQKNPFILFDEAVGPAAPSDGTDPNLARKQADRRAQFQAAAAKLVLKSVLMSATPLANISGKIVRPGDEIVSQPDQVVLRVSSIAKDSVTLVGEDSSLNLKMPFTLMLNR